MYDDDRKIPDPGTGPGEPADDGQQPLEFVNREEDQAPPAAEPEDDFRPTEPEPEPEPASGAAAATAKRRNGGRGRKQGVSRTMLLVVALIICAAVFIFWPRGGGDMPEGLGDQISVVTRDSVGTTAPPPRSSDVDLDAEVEQVVPESAGAEVETEAAGTEADMPDAEALRKAADAAEAEAEAAKAAESLAKSVPVKYDETPIPGPEGMWAVQLSAFANAAAADAEAERCKARGLAGVSVHHNDQAGDRAPHKVQVAFFASREAAKAWLDAHKPLIGEGPYVVER